MTALLPAKLLAIDVVRLAAYGLKARPLRVVLSALVIASAFATSTTINDRQAALTTVLNHTEPLAFAAGQLYTTLSVADAAAATAFSWAMELNRMLGKRFGLNAGRLFFGSVHDALGGNVRFLISGGAALPKDTAAVFKGLGLPLAEGYGLTEAAPLLTVAKPSPAASPMRSSPRRCCRRTSARWCRRCRTAMAARN